MTPKVRVESDAEQVRRFRNSNVPEMSYFEDCGDYYKRVIEFEDRRRRIIIEMKWLRELDVDDFRKLVKFEVKKAWHLI